MKQALLFYFCHGKAIALAWFNCWERAGLTVSCLTESKQSSSLPALRAGNGLSPFISDFIPSYSHASSRCSYSPDFL